MVAKRALSALSKIGIVIAIAVAFLFGLAGTVYLSLRSPEVQVPDVKGKDRVTAEAALDGVGLHMKVRATRFSPEAKPDTVLDQLPEKDQVIKVGQTVAVVIARAAKEGESRGEGPAPPEEKKPEGDKAAENQNTGTTSATNQNENQNKPKKPKNTNKNSNNSNNANNGNANGANRNANARNANNGNANSRNANAGNRNAAQAPGGNTNANRRAPVISTPSAPPSTPGGPPR